MQNFLLLGSRFYCSLLIGAFHCLMISLFQVTAEMKRKARQQREAERAEKAAKEVKVRDEVWRGCACS
jgi:hypothetical protein